MNRTKTTWALALAMTAGMTGAALAQPETKLTSQLDKQTIQAIWCSALFFEESFAYEDGSEDYEHYDAMAFGIGTQVDTILADQHGMRQAEIDEIWSIFDDEAYWLAGDDEDSFLAQLASCETNYDRLL